MGRTLGRKIAWSAVGMDASSEVALVVGTAPLPSQLETVIELVATPLDAIMRLEQIAWRVACVFVGAQLSSCTGAELGRFIEAEYCVPVVVAEG